jgi:hypothetical protein
MNETQVQQHMDAERAAEVEAPVETPAVETQSDEPVAAAEPQEERKQPDTVPLAVHLRRQERYERQLQEQKALIEQGNQRLQELWTKLTPREPEPDPDDILGRQAKDLREVKSALGQLTDAQTKTAQENEARAQIQRLVGSVKNDEAEFTKSTPDYPDAVTYAKNVKREEYLAIGMSPQEADGRLQADAFAIAQQAYARGESPADMAYRLARALGYKAQPKQAEAANVVAMRQQGQRMAQGTGGGGGKSGVPSFADLASMPKDEFEKLTSSEKDWKRIAGG